MASQCRQNYHEDSEAGVNKQINMELFASYTYLSMVSASLSLITLTIVITSTLLSMDAWAVIEYK